jgi:phage-related protein
MQLMGKSANELNPLIEDGGKTYGTVADTLKKYDLEFVSQKDLDNANKFNDSVDTIKTIGLVTFQNLGTKLAGYLAPALEKVANFIGNVAKWLNTLSPEALTIIGVIASVLAVVAPLLLVLGKFATSIGAIINLANTLGVSMGALAGPIGIAIAVIAALIAIGVLLYKNWDTIKATAENVKQAVINAFNNLKTAVTNAFNNLKTAATNVWNAIKTAITTQVNNVKTAVSTTFNNVKTAVSNIFKNIKTTATNIWNGIKSAIETAINNAKKAVSDTVTNIKTKASDTWNAIKTTASTVWNNIKKAVEDPINNAKTTVSNVVDKIASFLNFSGVVSKVTGVFNDIKSAITGPIDTAKNKISELVNKVKGAFPFNLGKIFNLKLPHISVSGGKAPYGIGGLGSLPKFSIKWYDQGGIFKSPSVIGVGEKRPEFVGALDDLRKIVREESGARGVTINVYATENQSVQDIAKEVERRLIAQQQRRRQAW